MLAFKGFDRNMCCTMGRDIFRYEVGKTYKEKECKCSRKGFHCCENPLDVLTYYNSKDSRYCIVKAEGDINQDAIGTKITCTKMTIVKEITRLELYAYGCEYMRKYPERESSGAAKERGICQGADEIIIVRGKKPKAKAVKGGMFFLVQEEKTSRKIKNIFLGQAGAYGIKPNTYYAIRGQKLCEEKN